MLFLNQDKKMVRLMSLLYQRDGEWQKYTDLARGIDASPKTVKIYIENLEKIFYEYVQFQQTGSMVQVVFDPNFGLLTMHRIFLFHSLIVQILYHSFFSPNIEKIDLSLDLDCSESSIFRNIRLFNQELPQVYDLEFSYSQMQFIGPEREIQKFYINFFIEVMPDPLAWPFEKYISEEDVQTLAYLIGKYIHGRKMYPAHFKYIKIALGVSLIRLQQGFVIPVEEYSPIFYPKVEELVKVPAAGLVLDHYVRKNDEDRVQLMYQILTYFLSEEFFFFLADSGVAYKDDPHFKQQYAFFKEKAQYLQEKYGLIISDLDEFYNTLFIYFRFKISNVDASDFFINHSDYFLNYVRFFNIDFHRDVYAFLEEFLERFHPQYRHRAKHLTYTVYTLWPNLLPQLINGLPSYKALVVSHYDHYYAQIIKNLINSIDTNMLEAEVYEGCEITTDILREAPHEVIITDFVVREKLENKIIFSFEQLPMPQKMEKLIKTICLDQIRRILEEHPGEFTDYRHDSGLE